MSFGPGAELERIQFVERMFASVPARSLVRVVATLRMLDVRAGLDALDVPTLVMVGARDRITPPGVARDLAMNLSGAEFVSIAGAGHMPMLEKPDEFNDALRAFLEHPGALYGGRRIGGARAPQIAPD
jgi:pimeloyl-ACP methyl ester carboxylesterase